MTVSELELIYEEIEISRTLAEDGHPGIGHLLDTYEGQASARLVLDMVKSHYEEESEQ